LKVFRKEGSGNYSEAEKVLREQNITLSSGQERLSYSGKNSALEIISQNNNYKKESLMLIDKAAP